MMTMTVLLRQDRETSREFRLNCFSSLAAGGSQRDLAGRNRRGSLARESRHSRYTLDKLIIARRADMRAARSSNFMEATMEAWKPPNPPQPSYQLFECNCTSQLGDTLYIVGSTAQLGDWNVNAGIKLSTCPERYPIWYTWVSGCLPACEFKFVVVHPDGSHTWEAIDNRRLPPRSTRVAAVFDVGNAIIATAESDAELYGLRELLVQRHARDQAERNTAKTASSSHPSSRQATQTGAAAPHRPQIPTADPLGRPPSFSIGSPLQPREPWQSTQSSACPSRQPSEDNLRSPGGSQHGAYIPGLDALKRTPSKSCLSTGSSLQVSRSVSTSGMRSGHPSSSSLKRTVSFNEMGSSGEADPSAQRPSRNASFVGHWSQPGA